MDPYRSDHGARASATDSPHDQGIVGDIIAQFADPLAFYRELIQNSIDAGSPTIEVKLEYDVGACVVRVAVRDRGEGMTRDILENQLLVLFRSTKEKDDTKIGKFGIGFTSVLSPNPEVVVVQSSRDGRRLTLHLMRDLTYQLFDAGPATQTGTIVGLDLAMRADQVEQFARDSIDALTRWCRHASVPLTFVAQLPDGGKLEARIDRPLALDHALVEVTRTTDGGKLTAVVGLLSEAAEYVGFFNHGLTLKESGQMFGRVAVKLQDGRLGHTLSRDDVRRDANLTRAIEFANEVIAHELPAAASRALHEAAQRDHDRWWQLAKAICQARVELARDAWWFPLLAASGQALAIQGGGLGKLVWIASSPSALTARLIERGDRVLVARSADRDSLRTMLRGVAPCNVNDVEVLTAITPEPPTDADVALLALMNERFALGFRAPRVLFLATFEGKHADALAIACGDEVPQLVDDDEATKNPFGRRTRGLALSVHHEWLVAARACDPRIGASLLVRVLLDSHGVLDVARSTSLLDEALTKLGVDT